MSFNWKQFLVTLAALAPTIIAGTAELSGEASTATKTQLATDSLNMATGLSQLLLSSNSDDQAIAGYASQITGSIITATSQAHATQGLPSLHPAPTDTQTQAQSQTPALVVTGAAKQVG